MDKKDFVLEIGTEELPANIVCLSQDEQVKENLVNIIVGGIDIKDIKSQVFITPRRIIIFIKNLPITYERIEEGPPKKIAYETNGRASKALEGFLKKIDATEKDIIDTPQKDNDRIRVKKYLPIKQHIQERLPKITSAFSSFKNMHWDNTDILFPRPIRWVLAILGNEVITEGIDGLCAGNITYGHRLLNPYPITVKNTQDFFKKLKRANVIYDFNERKQIILKYLTKKNWHNNEQLLEEVAGLTEQPVFIDGKFNFQYLKLPEEVLIASMSKNQRIFPLQNRNGKLINKFVAVINGRLKRRNRIRLHYEQVLDAKLKDALFFYNEDLKHTFSERTKLLKGIIFHKKLGSYFDKAQRLQKLTGVFKDSFNLSDAEYEKTIKACLLCKADLSTQMVAEFPSLQGVMGKYYTLTEGIDKEVAVAIEEHYKPRFSDDKLPQTKLGTILALLDKCDSVICHFKAGNQPKGNWDLYALRRQSIGTINIILEKKMNFYLTDMFDAVFEMAPGAYDKEKIKNDFMEFIKERLTVIMSQEYKFRHDLINAVISSGFDNVYIFLLRLKALDNIIDEFYFEQARCIVERTNNITKNTLKFNERVDVSLLQAPEEKTLQQRYNSVKDKIATYTQENGFNEATRVYAEAFYNCLEEFFNKVMVNVDDEKIKNNRLKLMKDINELYVKNIADLSKIVK